MVKNMDSQNYDIFKIYNADDFNFDQVMDFFVNPLNIETDPFAYENSIIKGKMGSGKTMYLKANYSIYKYCVVESIAKNLPIVIPIYVKLSDYAATKEPEQLYKQILKRLIKELTIAYRDLEKTEKLTKIHHAITKLPSEKLNSGKLSLIDKALIKMNVKEYKEYVKETVGVDGSYEHSYFKASANFEKEKYVEISKDTSADFEMLQDAFESILDKDTDRILFLFDEAGSITSNFFKPQDNLDESYFMILMNQLRTLNGASTKIAIYPDSDADVLKNIKFGRETLLTNNIYSKDGYDQFRVKILELLERYLNSVSLKVDEVFDRNSSGYNDSIEQLIFASNGNFRSFIHFTNEVLNFSNSDNLITKDDVFQQFSRFSDQTLMGLNEADRVFISKILVGIRSKKSTYRFKYVYQSYKLQKFIDKKDPTSLIRIIDSSAKKHGITYCFNYPFSVGSNIATHYLIGSEGIDYNRSYSTGVWTTRVYSVPKTDTGVEDSINLIGNVVFTHNNEWHVLCDNDVTYFLTISNIISANKTPEIGDLIEFKPYCIDDKYYCQQAKILDDFTESEKLSEEA